MKAQLKKLAALAAVVMLVGVGCGAQATPLPTPAPATVKFPSGTFTMKLGDNQWAMSLGENGTCSIVEDRVMVSTGVYKVTGNQLEWLENAYCAARGAERGTYTWSFDGEGLTFQSLQDGCADRKAWLDNIRWTKKP